MSAAEPLLEARGLYRFFHIGDDETAALHGVELRLRPGEFVAVMGPSGSGKSTLLACLTGLDEPDAGAVTVAGRRLTRRPEAERARLRARHFGILRQSGNLFPQLSVRQNIALQRRLAGVRGGAASAPIDALLERVALAHRGDDYPASLSGGETARAALAVALAADPAVLIADEPTAEVDRDTEDRLLDTLAAHCAAGRAVLVATHSAELARRADRIVRLRDGGLTDV
ncbi:ABC transporter ATP-binding protein [Acidihalobacter ferrooxydans]|uniref:ABC transporter ATP-binding protein n=1 Tax=Acidihalobacter ferrooxydans TaxID=1765967 RepID=A0A1P8UEX0_9GAMM|nr:ABC transporter ATP-binding protein [Acidihalobacter ferrooxydans]APZ42403.1 ABC transporter ATP-binding protein [Acidihalobacter ferrooxydans]